VRFDLNEVTFQELKSSQFFLKAFYLHFVYQVFSLYTPNMLNLRNYLVVDRE